jgi:hypothetical protein
MNARHPIRIQIWEQTMVVHQVVFLSYVASPNAHISEPAIFFVFTPTILAWPIDGTVYTPASISYS